MMNLTQKPSEGRKIAQIVLPKIFYLYQQKIKRTKAKVIKEEKQKKYSIEKLIKLTLKKLNKDDK